MRSTAHIGGHPIHPMLIPYPFALLTSAVAFDVWARLRNRRQPAVTAHHLTVAGLAAAVVAAVPGVVDYFGSVTPGTARRDATWHALLNSSALTCFAFALKQRDGHSRVSSRGLAFGLLGASLLGIGGWLGGELVYRERIGVHEAADELPLLPAPPM